MIWGAPSGTDDTYYKRLLDGGLPVFRTFDNCVDAVKAYQDYWTFAARYRSPFDDAPTDTVARGEEGAQRCSPTSRRGEALSEWQLKQLLKAYGIKSIEGRAVHVGRGSGREAAKRDRLSRS